ncbi:hypothetical protein BKA67DRAFT_660000 [Truncatella angustata]|uniref:Uncharacterized protein n=1 Tax=Truncatella angustata TaxID=152316 RepID=A0A9P8ZXV6_9PEZI|nr:uncharacterized protein BKA67DRAFT_660000 [Truncatella angustata]KAH6653374.1 hypothetical protein BKA67DRAFT_660000 [Truncatella angustata]
MAPTKPKQAPKPEHVPEQTARALRSQVQKGGVHGLPPEKKIEIQNRILELEAEASTDPKKREQLETLQNQLLPRGSSSLNPRESIDQAANSHVGGPQNGQPLFVPAAVAGASEGNDTTALPSTERAEGSDTTDLPSTEKDVDGAGSDVDDLTSYMGNLGITDHIGGGPRNIKPIGWLKMGWGYRLLIQYGEDRYAKYRFQQGSKFRTSITKEYEKNLKDAPNKIGKDEKVLDLQVKAVAWVYPDDEECPVKLLLRKNWPRNRRNDPIAPGIWVKVRRMIEPDTPEGGDTENQDIKPVFIDSWETRNDIDRLIHGEDVTLAKELKFGKFTIFEESEVVPKIDALIVATAIWAETRYQKRPEIKKEKNRDGSPTPAPDINAISDVNMTG